MCLFEASERCGGERKKKGKVIEKESKGQDQHGEAKENFISFSLQFRLSEVLGLQTLWGGQQ
jgi:hypothetical protein